MPPLAADLAASLFLSLFAVSSGAVRAEIRVSDLLDAIALTGPRGVVTSGHRGVVLVGQWERAGLVHPVSEGAEVIELLPRGTTLLTGPFRWDRLSRVLRRQSL